MKGIRIFSHLEFAQLFAPSFPELTGRYWMTLLDSLDPRFLPDSTFDEALSVYTSGPAAAFERDVVTLSEDAGSTFYGRASASDLFPKYAASVSDDWATIFCLRTRVGDPLSWMKEYFDSEDRVGRLSDAVA